MVDGMAVHGGDMVLGRVEDLHPTLKRESHGNRGLEVPRPQGISATEQEHLWPRGIVPYHIDDYISVEQRQNIQEAIAEWNEKTVISLVARTAEANYVRFANVTSGNCRSRVGMVGGEQSILLPPGGCSVDSVVHEIGHAVGLWHEHQRVDRDEYVTLLEENLDKRAWTAYTAEGPASGPYDYTSAMHYDPRSASSNGKAVLETVPPGITIPSAGLSAGDVDGVARLYGKPPEATSITTNPSGLEIVVDGVRVTTPASFDWEDGTTHILEVPVSQERDGIRYLFGRWNDGGSRLRNVTVGSAPTWLEANLIVQHRIGTRVEPSNAGRVALSPDSPDGFYTIRTQVQAMAAPAEGSTYRFLRWRGVSWGHHGRSSNPAKWTVERPGKEFVARFTSSPIYRIESNVNPFLVYIDNYYDVDDYWTYGPTALETNVDRSVIRLGTDEVRRLPGNGLRRLRFESWSDGGARSHDITLPAAGGGITAQIASEYPLSTTVRNPDSGRITLAPPSTDGYYREGESVVLSAVPNSGWEFVEWMGNIGSREPTTTIAMDRPVHVEAVFSQARKVLPGEPKSVVLQTTNYRFDIYDEASGFRIEPPSDAGEIRVSFSTSTPGVDVDLFVKAGSDSLRWNYGEDGRTPIFDADFQSARPGNSETVVINSTSDPPLDTSATYYVSLVVFAGRTRIDGTLGVDVERSTSAPRLADVSPRALTFVSPLDADPPTQVVRLTNRGSTPFRYVLDSDKTWLTAYPANGTLAAGATTEARVSALSAGTWPDTHGGQISVTLTALDGQIPETLAPIPVAFVVTPDSSDTATPLVARVLNGASWTSGAAPGARLVLGGTALARGTGLAEDAAWSGLAPLPTVLQGASVTVTDSVGIARLAGLMEAWPTGISFLMPHDVSEGAASVIITHAGVASDPFSFEITAVAPGLFSANVNGSGPAWAYAIQVNASGRQSITSLADFDASVGSRASIPLDLGPEGNRIYLELYGTGIRGWESNRSCTVGGENVAIYSLAPSSNSPGLDRIIVGPLPRSLAGRGTVNVILVADNRSSNSVTVDIQ